MTHKHTPGPWTAKPAIHGPIDICDPSGRDIVTVYSAGVDSGHNHANARLIAAAPDLLDALERIAAIKNENFGGDWDEIEAARQIAREALILVAAPQATRPRAG